MTSVSNVAFLEAFSTNLDTLEEMVGFLSLSDIVNLSSCSAILRCNLESITPLHERRAITQRANLLTYGPLLFSPNELRKIAFNPSEGSELTRSYKTSYRASKIIRDKINHNESFFTHQTEEQLNALAIAIVKNKDDETLRWFMESPRFSEISFDSLSALTEYLGKNNNPLIRNLTQTPRFESLTHNEFNKLIVLNGILQENPHTLTSFIMTANFNNMTLLQYMHLLNLSSWGPSDNFIALANHVKFQLIQGDDFQTVCEQALFSNNLETVNFFLDSQLIERISPNTLIRAFQRSCFDGKDVSAGALLNLLANPETSFEISSFSLAHAFDSLCEKRSPHIPVFINSALFSRVLPNALLDITVKVIKNNDSKSLDAILSSLHVKALFENKAFDQSKLDNITKLIREKNNPAVIEVVRKHFEFN